MQQERIILGIDPGTTITGYGIIKVDKKNAELVQMGVINLRKISDTYLKLKQIFKECTCLIDQFTPDELAIEAPFYGKNVQSMLKLGRAQGVAISAALERDIPIYEYAPRKIKLAITGIGSASKEQVAGMLQKILKYTDIPESLDATDGLAVALCHYYQRNTGNNKKYRDWKDYAQKKALGKG